MTFDPPAGFVFSQTELEVGQGEATRVQVEAPATPWDREQMGFTTNDPDRQAQSIELRRSNNGIAHSTLILVCPWSLPRAGWNGSFDGLFG